MTPVEPPRVAKTDLQRSPVTKPRKEMNDVEKRRMPAIQESCYDVNRHNVRRVQSFALAASLPALPTTCRHASVCDRCSRAGLGTRSEYPRSTHPRRCTYRLAKSTAQRASTKAFCVVVLDRAYGRGWRGLTDPPDPPDRAGLTWRMAKSSKISSEPPGIAADRT